MSKSFRCQNLVIGSGPGGSVTAWILASHGRDVLLVEEGPDLPLGSCAPFSIDEMSQKYRYGGLNPALGEPRIPLVEGRCVGGGSEINSALYHRTPGKVLELWRTEFDLKHAGMEDMRPHFEDCERVLSVQSNPGAQPRIALKMRTGGENMGWKTEEVPRAFKYETETTDKGRVFGKRQSMTETLIPCAVRAGARLQGGVRVSEITRRKDRWNVTALGCGVQIEIDADAVFVCGGSIQTPALLRRSGIRRNIGNSLSLHPMIKVVAVFDEEVNDGHPDVAAQQVNEFSPNLCMGCSISSLPYLALAMTDHPDATMDLRRTWPCMAVYYASIPGSASGRIRNLPWSTAPLWRFSPAPEDLRDLATGLRRLCQVLFAAGAKSLYPGIPWFPPLRNRDDLSRIPAALPRSATLTSVHALSSCPMGERSQRSAVDSFGRVHGQRNLVVNDASVLCGPPGVNPQGTIMAFARRNTLHFLKGL